MAKAPNQSPLSERWENPQAVQGAMLQMYFCPQAEKEYLASQISTLDWMDYVYTEDGKEYKGALVTVTDEVGNLISSKEYLAGKAAFHSISAKYLAEIERLKSLLNANRATASEGKRTRTPKGDGTSTAPLMGEDGFPKFRGKPGKLSANTEDAKKERQSWREVEAKHGAGTVEMAKYAKALMQSPKSAEKLISDGDLAKWSGQVALCAEYDSKH